MSRLIVVNRPKRWPLRLPDATVISAREYLTDPKYAELRGARVFNLCKSYRYQSMGYYVSLLAMARGHKPMPSITTIQDLKLTTLVRLTSDELEASIERSLKPIRSDAFTLSVYFGCNTAQRYDTLAGQLFGAFQAPFLRAEFARDNGHWRLRSVRPIAGSDIPENHKPFVIEAAERFFKKNRVRRASRTETAYDMAILHDPEEIFAPSDEGALKKFVRAGRRQGINVELIKREDYNRLAEFDALFIRETTKLNHHTYRFSRRAAAEGLVVIDDPDSIARCTNKVYLAELLVRHRLATPRTLIVHRDNAETVAAQIGLPCVLKEPDGSFSQGVVKADTPEALHSAVARLLEDSDLIIAQEFMPTPFDWRVAVLAGEPLFVCKYHMATAHWQIAKTGSTGQTRYGRVEAVTMSDVPRGIVGTAVRAANLIGDGLYGVDLKRVGRRTCVIEINDNPNIDGGQEDRLAGDALYDRIIEVFLDRIQKGRQRARRTRT